MPLSSKCLITDRMLEALRAHSDSCSDSLYAHVRVYNSRYREAYVCDLYACIQMSIYVIASVYVWVHVTV